MCGNPFKKPKANIPPPPAPPPPPPERAPKSPRLAGDARFDSETAERASARRIGRNALRIDLSPAGSSGQGVQTPRG